MKLLGIDFGTKKLGIAITDPGGSMVFPREIIQKRDNEQVLADLLSLVERENVEGLVVGLPVLLDGSETLTTRQARNFGNKLASRTGLPLWFVDERLSSEEAKSRLKEAGITKKKRKARLDSEAAVLILETHLSQCESPSL